MLGKNHAEIDGIGIQRDSVIVVYITKIYVDHYEKTKKK